MGRVGIFMKAKLLLAVVATATAAAATGCGAKEAQTSVDITPTEPVLEETETKETETQETETKETETEVIEEVKIDEAKAQELIKAYEDKIAEADIDEYKEELVYAFMTNYNNGDDADKAFESALEHAKELKEFDKAEEAKKQAEIDTKKREEEANKKAEEEAKQESTSEPAQTQEEPVSVPIPKQEEQAVQQTEQQEATPAGNGNSNYGQQPDGSFINSDGSVTHVGDVWVTPDGSQKNTYLGYAGF